MSARSMCSGSARTVSSWMGRAATAAWTSRIDAVRSGFVDVALVALVAFGAACRSTPLPPTARAPLTSGNVIALAAAGNHTCALLRDGHVACWGSSPARELRDDITQLRVPRPTIVEGLERATAIATTTGRVCAIDDRANLWCWGENTHGAILPDAPIDTRIERPTRIDFVKDVRTVTTSEYQTCALEGGGRVLCWGQRHQMDGRIFVAEDDDPVELASGRYHHCARLRHGEVSCWGAPDMDVLGNGDEGGNSARARISDVV